MMASLKLVLLFCCVSKCETDQSSRSKRPSKPFLTASILMQCNPSLDLCNPTPSWWLGWVGWGWQARQFGFTTLYILQPQTMASCRCCRVFLLYIWGEHISSAFHKRSKWCLSPSDGVCDLVLGRVGLLVRMPVWRGNYSSNMVACAILSRTSLLSALFTFYSGGCRSHKLCS